MKLGEDGRREERRGAEQRTDEQHIREEEGGERRQETGRNKIYIKGGTEKRKGEVVRRGNNMVAFQQQHNYINNTSLFVFILGDDLSERESCYGCDWSVWSRL